jgi:hypothetical protein
MVANVDAFTGSKTVLAYLIKSWARGDARALNARPIN